MIEGLHLSLLCYDTFCGTSGNEPVCCQPDIMREVLSKVKGEDLTLIPLFGVLMPVSGPEPVTYIFEQA